MVFLAPAHCPWTVQYYCSLPTRRLPAHPQWPAAGRRCQVLLQLKMWNVCNSNAECAQ